MMATPRVRLRDTGGTARTIDGAGSSRIRARDDGDTLRTITRVRVRDQNNVLRVVYDPSGASTLTATPSDADVIGIGIATATTVTVTVTAAGGTAPYSYAWTRTSSSHPTTDPTATVPTAATTAFRQTNMNPAENYTSLWLCTVTDSAVPASTADCSVTAAFLDIT